MGRRLIRRATVVPAVLVLLVGGGGLAWAASGSGGAGYRTTTVGRSDVEQLLTVTGTTNVVSQAKAAFPVAGTVDAVKVKVGDTVRAGEVLATLDTSSLQTAVIDATAVLTKAKATLETDSATQPSTPATAAASPSVAAASSASGSGAAQLSKALATVDKDLAAAQQTLRTATDACSGTAGSPSPSPATTGTPQAGPSASSSPSPSAAGSPTTGGGTGCASAMTSALQAQQDLLHAEQTASALLAKTSSSAPSTGSGRAASTAAPATTTAQGSSSQGGGGSSSTSQAARITTDTAAVDAAQVAMDLANGNLAAASLRSPMDGTVASQPYVAGSPEATSAAITVVGTGAGQVTAAVTGTQRSSLAVGQQAKVTPDGAASPVAGVVTSIGLVPTTTSSGSSGTATTTYPVTVVVARPGKAFVDGGIASVSIVVKTAKNAISVPNSALSNSTVTVLTAGKPVRTRVTAGAVGALFTQITSGLAQGQTIVLADLSQALPANSTTTTRTGFGGATGGGPPGGLAGTGAGARPGG